MTSLFALLMLITSCEELNQLVRLSDEEIVEGLKEALHIGVDNSVETAAVQDGYLKNEIIKILLPPEVRALQTKIETGSINLGITSISYSTILAAYVAATPEIDADPFEELYVAMNRGAENAADKASPIFANALANMTVTDGLNILQGDSTAATAYFNQNTNAALQAAFQPEVSLALGDTKANAIYEKTVGFLNYSYSVAGLTNIKVSDFLKLDDPLPATLDAYATEKAIDGLFYLVGEEEKKIRKDPYAWGSQIIAKVFGSNEAKGG